MSQLFKILPSPTLHRACPPLAWRPTGPDDLCGPAATVAARLITKARKLHDDPAVPVKILLYSPPGVGKTSIADNYTLVANSPAHGTTPQRMEKRLANEQYRQWLVELVRPHMVVLITARPETWAIKTLDRIEEQTGWRPQDACFAPKGWWNPPAIKEHLLKNEVFPIHGEHARYIAIESNPRSREMYARHEIPCFWVAEEGTCLTEGTRIVKRL